MKAHLILNDEDAERIGAALAADFGLERAKDHKDRWQTTEGTFTNKGIARRAIRLIEENAHASEQHFRREELASDMKYRKTNPLPR